MIREALIEGRTAEEKYEKDGYALKWTFVNELELIFVVSCRTHDPSGMLSLFECTGSLSTYSAADIHRRPIVCYEAPLYPIF